MAIVFLLERFQLLERLEQPGDVRHRLADERTDHGFDFLRMKPDDTLVKGGLPAKGQARALAKPGKQYALYLSGGPPAKLELALPAGRYRCEWLDPESGMTAEQARAWTAAGLREQHP